MWSHVRGTLNSSPSGHFFRSLPLTPCLNIKQARQERQEKAKQLLLLKFCPEENTNSPIFTPPGGRPKTLGGKWNCEMMECAIFLGGGEGMEGEGPQDLHRILLAKKRNFRACSRIHMARERGGQRRMGLRSRLVRWLRLVYKYSIRNNQLAREPAAKKGIFSRGGASIFPWWWGPART